MAEIGKIDRLEVLYMHNEKSDKVWGYFLLTGYSKLGGVSDVWVRFWGKRTATKFGIASTNYPDAQDLEISKRKKGYLRADPNQNTLGPQVQKTLWDMFQRNEFIIEGNTYYPNTPATIQPGVSLVTGKLMQEFEIRPSEVYKTGQIDNQIVFYGKKDNLLGKRPIEQKEAIFQHLKKTKTPNEIGLDLYNWS